MLSESDRAMALEGPGVQDKSLSHCLLGCWVDSFLNTLSAGLLGGLYFLNTLSAGLLGGLFSEYTVCWAVGWTLFSEYTVCWAVGWTLF